MKYTLLSSKGQITIPKQIQQELNIGYRSRLVLYPQKDGLLIKPLKTSVTEQTAGSLTHLVPKNKRGIPYSKVLEETKKIVARELVNE